jgi:predicted nucleic acid-binding protein
VIVTVFLDTNVLLYSISTTAQDAAKRSRALELLARDDCVLSVQVLQEFYVQATRASRLNPLPHVTAAAFIKTWRRFRIQDNTIAVLQGALEIKEKSKISYWDSAILAAASIAGCNILYSEDISHGQVIEGVRIINPFRAESVSV